MKVHLILSILFVMHLSCKQRDASEVKESFGTPKPGSDHQISVYSLGDGFSSADEEMGKLCPEILQNLNSLSIPPKIENVPLGKGGVFGFEISNDAKVEVTFDWICGLDSSASRDAFLTDSMLSILNENGDIFERWQLSALARESKRVNKLKTAGEMPAVRIEANLKAGKYAVKIVTGARKLRNIVDLDDFMFTGLTIKSEQGMVKSTGVKVLK